MQPVLLWFRRNLRLSDNSALIAAVDSGQPVIPLYVVDEQDQGTASRWWLHHSLASLDKDLRRLGSSLHIRSGAPSRVLAEIAGQTGATAIYFDRRYEPASRQQEADLRAALRGSVAIHDFDGGLLHDPEGVMTRSGTAYRVFTPFRKAVSRAGEPPMPQTFPASANFSRGVSGSLRLSELGLLPSSPDRSDGFRATWVPGESAALTRVDELDSTVRTYPQHRDRPDLDATSRLSPHLHFGEVSARQVWHAVRQLELQPGFADASSSFLRQLYWREFSTYLLFHFPDLAEKPLRDEFEHFPWSGDESQLRAWQQGKTGYPIVDAGMRQLMHTGWMHNRVRMIVASFLVKDLLVPWQAGAAWFLDNLVDADLANNSASWQWVSGCGSDAAPFFRIFNPNLQGRKFDPNSDYVRQWIPELSDGSASGYPKPIVDHGAARRRALEAFQAVKRIRTSKLAP